MGRTSSTTGDSRPPRRRRRLNPDGTPSAFLAGRLEVARALHASGRARVLLVSGDNRVTSYDEPTAMRDWLVAHDVPATDIVLDFAGRDTYEGVGDWTARRYTATWTSGELREKVAAGETVLDVLTGREPVLGPPETSVRDALTAAQSRWCRVWVKDRAGPLRRPGVSVSGRRGSRGPAATGSPRAG